MEVEWFRLEEASLSAPDRGRNESERDGQELFARAVSRRVRVRCKDGGLGTNQNWPAPVSLHLPMQPEPKVVWPTAPDGGDHDRERGDDL